MKKRIIWSNMDIDFDEWKRDLIECRKENGYEDSDDVIDDDVYSFINESLENSLEDERQNLNINADGRILIIADLGLWNGRHRGYRVLGTKVSDILYEMADYIEWYGDGYNIKATAAHHDGTNHYEYRIIRENRNIQNLLDAIYNGEEITRKKLNYYTKSLYKDVAKVYGW